uniref:Uncharacterized protein n=1 Tax=Anguilla anguilla TaxID=7936 RepID=A0A0E9TT70_ANGAN
MSTDEYCFSFVLQYTFTCQCFHTKCKCLDVLQNTIPRKSMK